MLSLEGPSKDCGVASKLGWVEAIDPFLDEDSAVLTSCVKDGSMMVGGRVSRCA